MRNTMKTTKALLLVLAVVMVVGLFAVSAFAAVNEQSRCDHKHYAINEVKTVLSGNNPYSFGICSGCKQGVMTPLNNLLTEYTGEADNRLNNDLLAGEDVLVDTLKYVQASESTLGSTAKDYTVEFDVYVEKINPEAVNENFFGVVAWKKGEDENKFAPQDFLRMFAKSETEAELRIGRDATASPLVTTIKVGEGYHFKLTVNPRVGQRSVVIESYNLSNPADVRTVSGTMNWIDNGMTTYDFRILEGAWGEFGIDNFTFYNYDKVEQAACNHADYKLNGVNKLVVKGGLYELGSCEGCGQAVVVNHKNLIYSKAGADNIGEIINDKILAGETIKVTKENRIYTSYDVVGSSDPYTIEFDVKINSIDSSKNNTSMLDLVGSNYQFFLRMFTSSSEEAQLRIGNSNSSPLVTTIKKGHSYHFKLVVASNSVAIEGYDLDTKETFRQTGTLDALAAGNATYYFRVFNNTLGDFDFSNFVLYGELSDAPCVHTGHAVLNEKLMVIDGKFYKTGKCAGCGEDVRALFDSFLEELSGSSTIVKDYLLQGKTVNISANKSIYIAEKYIGGSAKEYVVEFDIEINTIDADNIRYDDVAAGTIRSNGRTFLGAAGSGDSGYQHFLRVFVAPKNGTDPGTTTDYYDNKAQLRIGDSASAPLVTTIEEGHSYHFKLTVTPYKVNNLKWITIECYDLSAPFDVNTVSGKIGDISGNTYVRFLDVAWAKFYLANFVIYNS